MTFSTSAFGTMDEVKAKLDAAEQVPEAAKESAKKSLEIFPADKNFNVSVSGHIDTTGNGTFSLSMYASPKPVETAEQSDPEKTAEVADADKK